MNDRPTAPELIDAVRGFLEHELLPTLANQPRLRFQTLVAVNALSIAGRQLVKEESGLLDEWQRLVSFLDLDESRPQTLADLHARVARLNGELCVKIRSREFVDPSSNARLTALLRHLTEQKLVIANPRYLASQA